MAQFDLIVIGSGPGGYIAAIRGAQLGLATALVEKDPAGLGGTCLRRGCIPAKTWLETAHRFDQISDLAEYGIAGVDATGLRADLAAIVKRKNRIVLKNGKGVEYLMKKNKVTVLSGTASFNAPGSVVVAKADGSSQTVTAIGASFIQSFIGSPLYLAVVGPLPVPARDIIHYNFFFIQYILC